MTNTAQRVLAAVALSGAALACTGPAHADPAATRGAAQARSAASSADSVRAAVPDRAWQTLKLIDAGQWPPNDGSGTKGGTTWPNKDGVLPRTDSAGHPIQYLKWDVNRKQPGQPRDTERIVTGDDGSAWYTPDHLQTFERMR
ncbi:ribonuclease domain-containing protein [Streptacidiphilus rugosus]|uniref:ribonuclease domain-containing protein n=1 Tax=Streptacidiphilus rugosus TaxID=405783 RepID=UPI0005635F3E|nr:ribonuclease domain-containing protein [Streptacidiphilus rugosus]